MLIVALMMDWHLDHTGSNHLTPVHYNYYYYTADGKSFMSEDSQVQVTSRISSKMLCRTVQFLTDA